MYCTLCKSESTTFSAHWSHGPANEEADIWFCNSCGYHFLVYKMNGIETALEYVRERKDGEK